MELKEFIEQAISAIVDATNRLQQVYGDDGLIINPPAALSGNEVFQDGSENYTFRRVQNVDFDVALTVGDASGKSGKAGLRVFSVEAGGDISRSNSSEQVSRVRFAIPLTLKPSPHEAANKEVRKTKQDAQKVASARARSSFKSPSVV